MDLHVVVDEVATDQPFGEPDLGLKWDIREIRRVSDVDDTVSLVYSALGARGMLVSCTGGSEARRARLPMGATS